MNLPISHRSHTKQSGFGMVGILLVIFILAAVMFVGFKVYKSSQPSATEKVVSDNDTPLAQDTYSFSSSTVDSSRWPDHEPFQGFTLKYPEGWVVVNDSDFGRQTVNGTIQEDGSISTEQTPPFKTMFIESPLTRRDELNEIIEGAQIKIYMTVQESDEAKQKDPCDSTYQDRPHELVQLDGFVVCQTKVSKYGYDFNVNSALIKYRVTTVYSPSYSDEMKNEYNNTALEVVKSFNLY